MPHPQAVSPATLISLDRHAEWAGQRVEVNNAAPQDLQQIIGLLQGKAAPLDGSLVVDLAHEIEGEVTDHGQLVAP